MSKPTKIVKKIKENDLVDLIDGIVTEAVAAEKQQWINEQNDKTVVLEGKIEALSAKVDKLTEGK